MNEPTPVTASTRPPATGLMQRLLGHLESGLGWCEILRQDLTAARLAFDAVLALARNFGESHGALAVVAALQGRTVEAEASIRRASKLSPGGLSARFAHAVVRGDIQDREKFLRVARQALSRHPGTQGKTLADLVLWPVRPMCRNDPGHFGT